MRRGQPDPAAELEAALAIARESARQADPVAREALGDLLGAGGKALRPRILILSAMAGNYDAARIRPLAAAVELLHAATLVHDDVIDDSPERRGRPAAHVRIGRKHAVLAGDFLLSRAFLLASESASPDTARGLARAVALMVGAEIEQDLSRWDFSPSVRACLRKISGKTATLFALASRAGATESGAPKETVRLLSRAAWAAGVAFQIRDDVLDWDGESETLGKPVLRDVSEGLCTLPLAMTLSLEPKKILPLLSPEAIEGGAAPEIAAIVRGSGALAAADAMAETYLSRALSDLAGTGAGTARDALAAVYSSFVTRRA